MARRTLSTVPTIATLALLGVALFLVLAWQLRPIPPANTAPLALADLGRRVLVIATHPDDEVITAGGALEQLRAAGAQVRVVVVTAGDAYSASAQAAGITASGAAAFRALGEVRHAENARAVARLGLAESDVVRLGFSDGGVAAMWGGSWDASRTYTGRNGSSNVPYSWAQDPGAPQCGSRIASDLVGQIREFAPDTVVSPDSRETNTDHAAVAALTLYALDVAGFNGRHLTAVVHFKDFPRTLGYLPDLGLAPPSQLVTAGASWLALDLSPAAEQAKDQALRVYSSQLGVRDLSVYMRSFIRRNELFCARAASASATAATDARPVAGDAGTVVVTPPPVIAPSRLNPGRVRSMRMVRGPGLLWVGVMTDGPVSAEPTYGVSLRFAGGTASRRLDVVVRDGAARTLDMGRDSIATTALVTSADGDTLWIAVPLPLLADSTSAVAVCTSELRGFAQTHTPWVDVRLR